MKSNLDLLQELVACRPVSSDLPAVNAAMLVMRDFLQAQGVHCVLEKVGENQLLYASTRPGKVQDVLLNAHLDVVPAEDSQFTPRIEKGRIFARGVDDDLGCAVCIANVLCQKLGQSSVGAIFSADEELGGYTTAKMIELGYEARKLAIVMDGPSCNIAIAQKGIQIVELVARGRGGHSSQPWNCDNPIDKLIDAYLQLRQNWPKVTAEDQWHNTMAACICKAG
ncbi:MAG: M20/M25/M40 family metallo-hydrolase, partial [Oligosphaeraceae bacterium]|nr:M20/M25/M40 family metallo-hydrolase [Oligosphaeraceae bacterium]